MPDLASAQSADPIFQEEQEHLLEVYAQLVAIRDELTYTLEVSHRQAAQDLRDMSEEVTRDFGGVDETMETLAAIETLNSVIDAYNQSHDFDVGRLARVTLLLAQPYFAKVRLRYGTNTEPEDVYIGAAGITSGDYDSLVVDWRSPIAETYYNQRMGPCSYTVDGREVHVEMLLRRQFDISKDKLNAYFDTTVAIQDSLLLSALKHNHSEKLKAITATIQREQNEVVRHADVPALLVRGIAGSGKTSVLLQRIAYLFYHERDTLDASQVFLFTPNAVFKSYIDMVLPSLGERNPQTFTWREFFQSLGQGKRALGEDSDLATFERLERGVDALELDVHDFGEIRVNGTLLLKPSQIKGAMEKFPRAPMGPRRCALAKEELHERLDRKLSAMAKKEEVQDELLSLDLDDQLRIFGEMIDPDPADQRSVVAYTRRYLKALYSSAHDQIEAAGWLDVDHVGKRILGKANLNAVEWLYLFLLLTGGNARDARFVMVDEVQDYTAAQLTLLSRYFSRAHFLLLGDEHQAIREGTADLDQVREIFSASHAGIEECRLLTSYRSSPEITALFSSLVEEDKGRVLSSVQREGVAPQIMECDADATAYLGELRLQVSAALAQADEARGRGENFLTAIITADKPRANWLRKQLGSSVQALRKGEGLPRTGVIILALGLAKGLEFDQVIIPDAQAAVYPDSELSRRRLYTAISRAMHYVTILSQGTMTPLLGKAGDS